MADFTDELLANTLSSVQRTGAPRDGVDEREPLHPHAVRIVRLQSLHGGIAASVPQLRRGKVWCITCGTQQDVDAAECLRSGWPMCCGQTMTIDSPEERKAMKRKR